MVGVLIGGGIEIGGLDRGRPLMWSLRDDEVATDALAVIRILTLPPVNLLDSKLQSNLQASDFDARSAITGVDEIVVWETLEKTVRQSLAIFKGDEATEQQVSRLQLATRISPMSSSEDRQ